MDLPNEKVPYLKIAYDGLKHPLFHFLEKCTPNWIIYDFSPHWLPPIAANLGISGAFFSIFQAWSLTFVGSSSTAMIKGDDPRTKPEHFTVPPDWIPFPSKVAYRRHEARRFLVHLETNDSGVSDTFRMGTVMGGCDVIAVRSCNELEADFIQLLSQLHGKPVLPLGALPPSALDSSGNEDAGWTEISCWLDKQNKGSVVYIAFGSEAELSKDKINELALGLELSGLPFFWALRKHPYDDSVKLPDVFEERVKGRGLVWTSWAPQLRILGHESLGGVLTHSGYSSVIEALHFGRALIMVPLAIDQGLVARVFEEKKVGVEIRREEVDGGFTKDSVSDSLRLVVVDPEGKVYRDKAKEMMKLFTDEDLHDRYIDRFAEYLQNHCRNP